MKKIPSLLLSLAMCGVLATAIADDATVVLLQDGDINAWEYQSFDDISETQYQENEQAQCGQKSLLATSDKGASGYILQREFAFDKTPWLHFYWRVNTVGENPEEQTKAGDDYAWRLYIIGKSGLSYRTINFVYSQQAATGTTWESPYSGFLRDIYIHALQQHAPDLIGEWRVSSVNVAALWRKLFADEKMNVGAIGLMTDGDSAELVMQACYGAIILSDSPTPPPAPTQITN